MSIVAQFLKFVSVKGSEAEKAELAAMLADDGGVAVAERPRKGKGKRTLSPEQKAKMAEGRRKAAAAKGKAEKPAKPATKPAKAERVIEGETFAGNGHTLVMQEGTPAKRSGKVYVPMWVNGQFAGSMRADLARAIVNVLRSQAGNDVVAHCDLQLG